MHRCSFGVPYLKDTTPHWSTRGRVRRAAAVPRGGFDRFGHTGSFAVSPPARSTAIAVLYVYSQVRRMLQPLLAEIYGEGYAHALTRLADDSVQLR